MDFLGAINKEKNSIISSIPILPYFNSDIIFDPSSYGQYLDGTHVHPKNT